MGEVENREWVLSAYAPEGIPTSNHLKLRTTTLSLDESNNIPDKHILLQLLWISIDPYLRSRMTGRNDGLYSPQYPLHQVMIAYGAARVVRSKNSNYKEGEIVINPFSPISEYSVAPPDFLIKLDPNDDIPLPDYISCLGIMITKAIQQPITNMDTPKDTKAHKEHKLVLSVHPTTNHQWRDQAKRAEELTLAVNKDEDTTTNLVP